MKIKVMSVLVVFAMLFSMLCCYASAAAPMSPVLTLDASDGKYERGDLVEVTISVKDYVKLCLMSIQMTVDDDVLELSLADGVVEEDYTYATTKFGAPGAFNSKTLFVNWAFSSNKVVRDSNRVEMKEFDLLKVYFEVPQDAPLGKSTLSVAFAEKDANGGNGMGTTPSAGVVNPLVAGTDYTTAPTTIEFEIYCDHDFTDVAYTKPAEGTDLEEAKHSRVCTKCAQTITEACAFESKVTEPTHTEEGYTTHTCACGYVVVDSKTPAAGHDWGAFVHNETAEGQKHTHTRTCIANDGGSETQDCTFTQKYTDPTCTEDGYVTFTCGVCNYSYDVTDEGSAKGHSLTVYEHLNGTTHKKSCSLEGCGYSEEEACTFGAWEVTEEPTREKTGLKTRTCVHCKVGFETEVLPKVAYFTVSDASEACGHEFEVTVSLTNNPGLSGGVFEIAFDDTQMELIGAEVGALGADIPVLLQPANKVGDVYRIAFATEAGFEGDGELLKLKFRAADAVTEGDYTVSVGAIDVCDSSEEMVSFVIEGGAGTASLRNYLLGDIDRSGTVSVVDAVQLLRYLNAWDVTIEPYAAELDVNDGGITVADAQYLLQALIGLQTL